MNIIRLMGGLGNQFFQYALGRVQRENGIQVAYDSSWMETKQSKHPVFPRMYVLDKFNTRVLLTKFKHQPLISSHEDSYDISILIKDGFNFEGYWQYLDYYKSIIPVLQQEFTLRDEHKTDKYLSIRKDIEECDSVSVHIRRGDYLLHRKGPFGALPFKYYMNAIHETKGDLFVFSDDIPWARSRINPYYFNRRVTIVHLEDYQDFELMRLCRQNVTTNSTFSWWAGMINSNPDKKVICPMHWLGQQDTTDLHYPAEWIKMDDYVVY